jgi:hypothetical protein
MFRLGLIFSGSDHQLYARVNPLARQYVLDKLERRFQYNVTELVQTWSKNHSDIDTWSTLCTQLSHGIMSIIGHINYDDLDWLSGFCSTYQMPFLGLDNHHSIANDFYLSLMPDVLPALIAFIRRYQLNQLVYIYDDTTGALRLKQLMRMQTTSKLANLNIISRYLGDPDDSYDLLQNIELMTSSSFRMLASSITRDKVLGRFIVLDFHSFDTYRMVMDKIKHRGMTTADYHYILLTLNAKQLDMTYFRYGGVNVTFFALPTFDPQNDNLTRPIYERYMHSLKSIQKEAVVPVESLLIADAWEILLRTINHMLSADNGTRGMLKVHRQGRFYNGLTPGIDCRSSQIQPWSAGRIYLENLLNTSFDGLTGPVQFSNVTGQRINYKFDVYRVTRNEMPKQIGYFQAPTKLEVRHERKPHSAAHRDSLSRSPTIPPTAFVCPTTIARV